jgi:hypothetical protein
MPPSGSSRRTTPTEGTQRDAMTARERPRINRASQKQLADLSQSVRKEGNSKTWRHYQPWGGITHEPPAPCPSEPQPIYAKLSPERPLVIWGIDCTKLWHKLAEDEIKRRTRHLPNSHRAVARAFVRLSNTGGQYYGSQVRLGALAGVRRETTNRALRRLSVDLELLDASKHQRGYNQPKTFTLSAWFLGRVMKAVMRALSRGLGHTRKAEPSVEVSGAVGLPSYDDFLRKVRGPKRRYHGGVMIRCPAHRDRTPSLAVGEGQGGRLLLHCHAGCTHEEVRAALGLPPPKGPVTLRPAESDRDPLWEEVVRLTDLRNDDRFVVVGDAVWEKVSDPDHPPTWVDYP